MYTVVFLTALTVSIDALTAGIALASVKTVTARDTLTVGLVTFLLCAVARCLGQALILAPETEVSLIGGVLLFCVGLRNLFPAPRSTRTIHATHNSDVVWVGVAVGLDGALATLSLSLLGYNSALTPFLFGIMHALAVGLGGIVTAAAKKLPAVLGAILLLSLGCWKIATALF